MNTAMNGNYVRDRAAIAGIGYTAITRNSGKTVESLAIEACKNAILDAGLTKDDVDGLVEFNVGDSVHTLKVATGLGLPIIRWYSDLSAGGDAAVSTVAQAAMVVASGTANAVLVYRALNGRSGHRIGRAGRGGPGSNLQAAGPAQWGTPYGLVTPPQFIGMWCSRYNYEYNLPPERLGEIALTCRRHAMLNERAILRTPITMDDYLNSRFIAEPFRMLDCTIEVDGACAVLVTSAERARDLRRRPVYISGFAYGTGPAPDWDQWASGYSRMYSAFVADDLWRRTGFGPREMDFAEMYDCFTYTVLCTLEDFGFCAKGEGGEFVQGGRIGLGGELPINTHGGLLSEGYLHGLNHSCEAVSQLRGDAGPRQVPDAEVCLVSAGAGPVGGGIVYHV